MDNNIHDLYTRANTLMQGALKKYAEGNIDAVNCTIWLRNMLICKQVIRK